MKVIILEDEKGSANNLKALLTECQIDIEIAGILESVEEAESWLKHNPSPDLGFFDIKLSDGLSFSLFQKVPVKFPVVFTSAYSEYAIRAFKVNSLDYILKPVQEKDILFTFNKFYRNQINSGALIPASIPSQNVSYKQNFLVIRKNKLLPISTSEIAFFFIKDKRVFLNTKSNKAFQMEENMEGIQAQLDPNEFFRVNRQFLVSRKAIHSMEHYFNGRLYLDIQPTPKEKVLISKNKVPYFKNWISL